MKRKILLTGATGFVGGNLLASLLENGFEVICLIRTHNGEDPRSRLFRSLECSFTDRHLLGRLSTQATALAGDMTHENLGMKPDDYHMLQSEVSSILHCAASTEFHFLPSPQQWQCNVHSMHNIIRLALEGTEMSDFHYVSTAYVAGNRDGIVYEDELDNGQDFNNGYEKSKFMAEKILHSYRKCSRLKITIYRPSIVVGNSATGRTTLFNGMYLFLRLLYLLKKRCQKENPQGKTLIPLRVVGEPQVTKNFVPIDYVTRMIMNIVLTPHAWGKTYHLINPCPPTLHLIKEVMEELLHIKGVQFVHREAFSVSPPTPLEQLFARETEGYRPYLLREPNFDETLTRTLRSENGDHASSLLDREALMNLFVYAMESRWGKRPGGESAAGETRKIVTSRAENDSHSSCLLRR